MKKNIPWLFRVFLGLEKTTTSYVGKLFHRFIECQHPVIKTTNAFMESVSVFPGFSDRGLKWTWITSTEVLWRATGFQRDISILKVSLSWCC